MSHTDKTDPYYISHQSPRRKVVREECKRFTRQERRRLKVWLRQDEQMPDPILNSLLLSANTLINQPESWERSTALFDILDAAIEISSTDPGYAELASKIINICSKPFSAASAS